MTPTGWTCPKCGSVYAPLVVECHRCNRAVVRINPPESSPTTPPYEPPVGPSDWPPGPQVTCDDRKQYEIPLPYADSVRPKPEAPSLLARLKKLAEEENG